MKFAAPVAVRALCATLLFALVGNAQQAQPKSTDKTPPAAAATGVPAAGLNAPTAPMELARAAFNAQGGEKFRALKNMMLIGSVDMYSPGSTQSLSGKFGLIMAPDRARMNIQTPLFQLEAISDGDRTYSTMRQLSMPPAHKFGLPVLAKFDQPGYTVTALPDRKKERAFRITDAEGNATDFFIDPTTARIVRYEVPYNGLTFSVEYTKVQEYEGVLVPVNSTWKIDMAGGAYYAEFKAKEVKVNQTLPDNTFAIPDGN
jgi:outer membrane lipoprotein-sorting protein